MTLILKVGTYYDSTTKKGDPCKKSWTYCHVQYEKDGWADPDKFLPEDYDLVLLNRQDKNPIKGWVNGTTWFGFRLKEEDKVIGWRRVKEDHEKRR